MILDSEFHVFKSVEFKMPIYTTKNCVDVLLAASGLRNTLEIVKSASVFLDLSYICVSIYLQFFFVIYVFKIKLKEKKTIFILA